MPIKIRTLSLAAGLALFVRPDVPDARFRERAAAPELSPLVRIVPINGKGSGSGVLLASGVVVTAAHVVARKTADSLYVLVGGERFAVREILVHPDWTSATRVDLALLKLSRVPVRRPAELAVRAPSLPVLVVIGGFGIGGATRDDTAGTARAGENMLDLRGGDSGGPLFIRSGNALRLLAIYSHSRYRLDQWANNLPTYAGSRFAATDLTRFFPWLASHGVAVPSHDQESP